MLYTKVIYFYSLSVGSQGFVLSFCFLLHSQLQELIVSKVIYRISEFLQKKYCLPWDMGCWCLLLGVRPSVFFTFCKELEGNDGKALRLIKQVIGAELIKHSSALDTGCDILWQ